MTDQNLSGHIEAALDAVLAAGPIALEYFRKPMAVTNKMAGRFYDPVTEADRRIELLIRERLAAQYPDLPIIGEEFGASDAGESYWIIDPIDGTRSFISGVPTWGILLGLVVDGRALAGIMHQPFTGETFLGGPGRRATYSHAGRETLLAARADATLEDAVLYSTHPLMLEGMGLLKQFRALTARCRLQRWGGDCYAFALVAQGCIDLMVDAMLQPYDIVPMIPIIEGAGGVVTDLDGQSPLRGGTVIAAANASLHAAALEIMNKDAPARSG
ncbi:MAG TPA: inositol monophosphatase family protein [Steroidobacteraceae bacterium]|jgi:myo-inositol-1(or 4)-monophosphatase